jgi:hypothetical protein
MSFEVSIRMEEQIAAEIDTLFHKNNLICKEVQTGFRIYTGSGASEDYGRFWATFFSMKAHQDWILHIHECTWYDGAVRKDLLQEFLINTNGCQ